MNKRIARKIVKADRERLRNGERRDCDKLLRRAYDRLYSRKDWIMRVRWPRTHILENNSLSDTESITEIEDKRFLDYIDKAIGRVSKYGDIDYVRDAEMKITATMGCNIPVETCSICGWSPLDATPWSCQHLSHGMDRNKFHNVILGIPYIPKGEEE